MLKIILIEFFNLFFGKSKNEKNIDKSSREYQILSKKLDVNNRADMLERISYWIEEKDFSEAKKLSDLYVQYNSYDLEIQKLNKEIII